MLQSDSGEPSNSVETFSGPTAFAQLIRDALHRAAQEAWPLMIWCDATYEDWPLGEKAVAQALHDWAGPGRKLIMLAKSYDTLARKHARMVSWRVTWDHVVESRVCRSWDVSEFPSVLWAPQWFLHRADPVYSRGVIGADAARRTLLKEQLDECIRQSSVGFPATTLGL
jgi:hypothetical protein